MLLINVGNYNDALAYDCDRDDTPALAVVGHLTLTDERWSNLGYDYAIGELTQDQSSKRVVNVFCNNENFLNGVRVAIFEAERPSEEIKQRFKIQFFDSNTPQEVFMDHDARFNVCPSGFFDQIEKDLLKIF